MKYLTAKHFERLNLRIGTIKAVKKHPKVDEYILLIDLGPVDQDAQIVADLKATYKMKDLLGKQVVYLENFESTQIQGIESQGLLLITQKNDKPVLLKPDRKVLTGVRVSGIQDTTRHYHFKPGEHGKYR